MSHKPYTADLFGNSTPKPTTEQVYLDYINSPAWKRRAEIAKTKAGSRCERCGRSKYSRPLTVHHLTYEHLGNEKDDELQVLCHPCHIEADAIRVKSEQQAKEHRQKHGALVSGFAAWMAKGSAGESWQNLNSREIQRSWEIFVTRIYQGRDAHIEPGTCPFLKR